MLQEHGDCRACTVVVLYTVVKAVVDPRSVAFDTTNRVEFKLDAFTTISFPHDGSAMSSVLLSFLLMTCVAFLGSKEATDTLKVSRGATVALSVVCRGMLALNCDAVVPAPRPTDEKVTFWRSDEGVRPSGGTTVTTEAFAAGADVLKGNRAATDTGVEVGAGDCALSTSVEVRANTKQTKEKCRFMPKLRLCRVTKPKSKARRAVAVGFCVTLHS